MSSLSKAIKNNTGSNKGQMKNRKESLNIPLSKGGNGTSSGNSNSLYNNDMNFFAKSYVGSFQNTYMSKNQSGSHVGSVINNNNNGSMNTNDDTLPMYNNNNQGSNNGSFHSSSHMRSNSTNIHTNVNLHRETAALAHDDDDDDDNDEDGNENRDNVVGDVLDVQDTADYDSSTANANKRFSFDNDVAANYEYANTTNSPRVEEQYLLSPTSSSNSQTLNYSSLPDQERNQVSSSSSSSSSSLDTGKVLKYFTNPLFTAQQTVHYLPPVILGLLLNILDALSYGMIIFPITEPIFKNLGPSGLSLFYISSIISQLCYSCGLSDFGCSIGSEMIEITPFFHTMASLIANHYDNDDSQKDAVIATTIVSYCISSIITGLTFYSLGKLKLGKIVGFFPRHILIGCIGGVGYFLCITGIEVSTKIAKFQYNLSFLKQFLTEDGNFAKLLLPIALTIILIKAQTFFKNNSLVLPLFYMVTFFLFHFIVIITPTLSLPLLRNTGWIFPMSSTNESWYDFYSLFKFKLVNWSLVLANVPTMLALTFFGILHVPINVPALAMSTGCDKFDVDKELIAHGYSNFLSGIMGSIQNYLVYTNSVLFIRAGADSRFAGILLAIMTFIIMVIGPIIISMIPICIVGSLIFLLGYELIKEALYDTLGRLSLFEYLTIFIIVGTMGIFDFVLGIIVGILIACFSFLIDSTKLKTVNGEYDGTVAHSTVNRDYWQTQLLNEIGKQIYVLKLQNLLFFGTIISIEEKIDNMLNNEKVIIKYLILDFKNINADNIDYSAAEGFNRIKRFLDSKKIHLIISSISETDQIYNVFNKVGLLQGVELFVNLNSALEWCENRFLTQYKVLQERKRKKILAENMRKSDSITQLQTQIMKKPTNKQSQPHSNLPFSESRNSVSPMASTPRNNQFFNVAKNIYSTEQDIGSNIQEKYNKNLVLQDFLHSLKMFIEPQDFNKWEKIQSYFKLNKLPPGDTIPNDNCFFFVDDGFLKISYFVMNDNTKETIYETISSKCCYGKISGDGYAKVAPNYKDLVFCETECSIWMIDEKNLKKMRRENPNLYIEMVILIGALNQYRYKKLLAYSLVSS